MVLFKGPKWYVKDGRDGLGNQLESRMSFWIMEYLQPQDLRFLSTPIRRVEHTNLPLSYINRAFGFSKEELPGLVYMLESGNHSKIPATPFRVETCMDLWWHHMYRDPYINELNEKALRESPKIQEFRQRILSRPEFFDPFTPFYDNEFNVVIHVRLGDAGGRAGNSNADYFVRGIRAMRERAPKDRPVRFRVEVENPTWHGIGAMEKAAGHKLSVPQNVDDPLMMLGRMFRADAIIASNSSMSWFCLWMLPKTNIPNIVPEAVKGCSLRGDWVRRWCDQGKLLAL